MNMATDVIEKPAHDQVSHEKTTPETRKEQPNNTNNQAVGPRDWLEEHGDYLFHYAISRLHQDDLAADMVQETLLAGLRGYKGFAGNSTVRTWLIGIMKHKIIDHIRKEVRRRNLVDAIEHDPTSFYFNDHQQWADVPQAWYENPEDLCRNEQFKAVLQENINQLPDKQRIVFHMREIAGHDTATICKACDISIAHCHVLLHRARMTLRQSLRTYWMEQQND